MIVSCLVIYYQGCLLGNFFFSTFVSLFLQVTFMLVFVTPFICNGHSYVGKRICFCFLVVSSEFQGLICMDGSVSFLYLFSMYLSFV